MMPGQNAAACKTAASRKAPRSVSSDTLASFVVILPLCCAITRHASPVWLAFARVCRHIASEMSATIHRLDGSRSPSLAPMVQLVAGDLNLVNAVILARMQSEIPLFPALAGHLIAGGGEAVMAGARITEQ